MSKIKRRDFLSLLLVGGIIFGFSVLGIFLPQKLYSESERRLLAQKPTLSVDSVLSGKYTDDFEKYVLDRFPMRDSFRALKTVSALYILRQRDSNGLYIRNGHISKLDIPHSSDSAALTASKLGSLYKNYISGTDCACYLSMIPDKNHFLAPNAGYPTIDYAQLVSSIKKELDAAEYIDIFGTLSLDCYYKTDPHWRQEKLLGTARVLSQAMGAGIEYDYSENILDVPFYGAYCGQTALYTMSDTIIYLKSDTLASCVVTSYDTGTAKQSFVYDMEKAHGKDPYEMFLSGSDALLTIENPFAESKKELVIFRDSFASPLAPLLSTGYSKTTLVDLRYIKPELLPQYITFGSQDVLFLYSTSIFGGFVSM